MNTLDVAAAIFVPEGDGKVMRYAEGSVAVYRGSTDTGIKCLAVEMKHTSGNESTVLLSPNGAAALVILLGDALSLNDHEA